MSSRLSELLTWFGTGLLGVLILINIAIPAWIVLHLDKVSLNFLYRPTAADVVSADLQSEFTVLLGELPIPKTVKTAVRLKKIETQQGEQCAYTVTATRTISVDPSCLTTPLRTVLTHELGHVVDAVLMTEESRLDYCQLREITDCSTWGKSTYALGQASSNTPYHWQTSPAEDFAEEFVRFALDPKYRNTTAYGEKSSGKLPVFWQALLK